MPTDRCVFLRRSVLLLSVCVGLSLTLVAQKSHGPTTVRRDVHHDVSLPLVDLMRKAPFVPRGQHEAEPVHPIPLPKGLTPLTEDPVRQSHSAGYTPLPNLSFDGLGNGKYGFVVEFAPPDTNGAVGATQYVQWVNTYFAIFDKVSGALIAGPTAGNALWQGFGGSCETANDGDPVVVYDKLANRWVMSQLVFTSQPYMLCIAVSTSSDATGTWYRYGFQYANNLDDYPKMGVWPDAYYETFNVFLNGNSFAGADACAFDRNAMLKGQPSTQICFQQDPSVGGLLPADLDGATPPPAGSPNYIVNFGANSLNLYEFHVDFGTPMNSTFIGPTVINVAAFSPLCNGGSNCVPQPGTSNALDSLADRLMHRLAYRNFGDHESLMVNHSVTVSGSSGVRWYEIRSPNGTPVVAQQGTYAPDANYRWMGSIAMDRIGDIAVGYSVSSSSVYPSIAFAGRVPTDPPGSLEAETAVITGSGSQINNLHRWGDYSAMTVDPVDDCTFWYTQEYIVSNGSWNWNTRIVSFKFPGCTTGSYVTLYPTTMSFASQRVGSSSTSQLTTLTNHQSVSLAIGSITISGDFSQTNNCGASLPANSTCTINVTFNPTATGTRPGTLTVNDNGPGSPQTASLTGIGVEPVSCLPGTLSDGGFESGTLTCWTAGGVLSPFITTIQAHHGTFSAQLGASGLPEPNGDSSLYQTISIPSTAVSPTLSFWYWPATTDTFQYDWQEAQIRNAGGTMLAQIFKTASNSQTWTEMTFDLTPYKGQTIQLYFNVHEDGANDPTYMFLDDVSITTANPPPAAWQFVPLAPCRVVDTRNPNGVLGGPAIQGGAYRSFPLPQSQCNVPVSSVAYSLNVTVVPRGRLGYLTIWPAGQTQPAASTMNSLDGRVKANAAIVAAGTSQAVSVYATDTTDVVLDINGYFVPLPNPSALAFYPLTPCRVADTRNPTGPLGGPPLHGGQQRDFPVLSSSCSIPPTAQAYSMNFTVIPKGALGYLTVWPSGGTRPVVSTLNDPKGTVVANAAIVPAGTGGDINAYATQNTDLVIDINGYFAPAGAGGLSFYAPNVCRVLDTRLAGGAFSAILPVMVFGTWCNISSQAQAYVMNATVVPPGALGYLTLWPDGGEQPLVSTLNAQDGSLTSNMAIVPTTNGSIDAYASGITQLLLDLSGYFAP